MGLTLVSAYVPAGGPPPGRVGLVPLDVLEVGPCVLRVPGVTVVDVRGGEVLADESCLRSDPSAGGGPLADPVAEAAARAFALTNAAVCARRLLDVVEATLDRTLPPLKILTGAHQDRWRRWGGGHYRLPAQTYSTLPEDGDVAPTGEVHLGAGQAFVTQAGAPYLHVPGHSLSIVTHEVAHHVCRHVADFRLNRLLPPGDQTNNRTAIEEGTCDYLAAAMLGHPDIYGWHRQHISVSDIRRRALSAGWTMADFRGSHKTDPHRDGSVWACALWDARTRAARAGFRPEAVDALVVRGLAGLGDTAEDERSPETRRARKYFGSLLSEMLQACVDPTLADHVENAMAFRGIRPGWSNAMAREAARQCA
jgi:hypothetical protein